MAAMEREFPAEAGSLYGALAFAGEAAVAAGLDLADIPKLELALEEILVNVCNYAYDPGQRGHMTLRVDASEGSVVVEVEDAGREFEPPVEVPAAEGTPLADVPVGGVGVFLAGAMVDELSYRRESGHNIVRLVMRAAG
jgi:serine/threonine-protein kinase RsbW